MMAGSSGSDDYGAHITTEDTESTEEDLSRRFFLPCSMRLSGSVTVAEATLRNCLRQVRRVRH